MSDCLTYVIINLLWLCMLSYAWMKERFKKYERERKIIGQEDQMLELTFNFHGALSILIFFWKWAHHIQQEKQKEKRKKKEEKKKNRGEMRKKKRKKEKKKGFCLSPHVRKVNIAWPLWELIFWLMMISKFSSMWAEK